MVVLGIIIVLVAVFIWVHPYFIRYDTLVSFTGGLGSGKTFLSTETAIVLYRKARIKVALSNFLTPWKPYEPLPLLYSNIPLRISRKSWAVRLTNEHLLLQRRLVPKSVCLLDEVDCFANQFQFNNPCIVNSKGGEDSGNFDEFCRFYRHYTKGGYLIFNTQATANENLTIRRRQNTVLTLFHFRTWGIPIILPHLLYTVHVRNVTLSDDVKTVEEGNAEDNMRLTIGFMPWRRRYDTYCYSGRYETVPYKEEKRHKRYKINSCLIAPYGKQEKLTTNTDDCKSCETLQKLPTSQKPLEIETKKE